METEKIVAVLRKHGVTIVNDADAASVEAALETTLARGSEATAAAKTAKTVTDLQTQFDNERISRIERELDMAVTDGRITADEKADWERRLKGAQFSNELTALAKLPANKTQSKAQ